MAKAERNKVFREGWHGALRYFAVDGWEPIRSRHRHCRECLVRRVRVKGKGKDGAVTVVDEYYHRYVVAMLIDEHFDLMLDFEPLLQIGKSLFQGQDVLPDRLRCLEPFEL